MTSQQPVEMFADAEDFGLARHLVAIEAMYREGVEHLYRHALAYTEALSVPWPERFVRASSETEELPVTGRPPVRGMFADAA